PYRLISDRSRVFQYGLRHVWRYFNWCPLCHPRPTSHPILCWDCTRPMGSDCADSFCNDLLLQWIKGPLQCQVAILDLSCSSADIRQIGRASCREGGEMSWG